MTAPGTSRVPPERAPGVDAFEAFEAAGWERQASTYDDFLGRITRRLAEPLLDAAGVTAGTRVLDVATGPGHVAAAAAGRGASVIGVDIAAAMVGVARQLHPGIDFRQADAAALPFEAGSFDAVVSNFVVPHLGQPERAVAELVRVLDGGGRLALTTWDLPERMRLLGVVLDACAEAGATAPSDIPDGPPFFRFAVDEEFIALLTGSGLADVTVTRIRFDHRVSDADELWDGMMSGTVRTSALLLGQPPEIRRRVRAALDQLVLPLRRGDHLEIPVSVALASGRTPG